MALGRDVVDAIIREHSYRAIAGDVLLIGQQAVSLSRADVIDMMRDHGVPPAEDSGATTDGDASDGGMSAAAFFRLLGVDEVRSLDSCAGSADIIHDLDEPIPEQLRGSADFIIDNGAIGDVFAAASALRNHADLLRSGGRLIAVSNFSGHFDPYSMLSAIWYLDYFVVNGFADCKVYILVYIPDRQPNAFYLDIECLLDPSQEIRAFLSGNEMSVVVFAEKAATSTVHGTPTQARLRSPAEWERYRHNLGRINQSPRPHLVRSRGVIGEVDVRGGHLFVNRNYAAITPSQAQSEREASDDPDATVSTEPFCSICEVENIDPLDGLLDDLSATATSAKDAAKVLDRVLTDIVQPHHQSMFWGDRLLTLDKSASFRWSAGFRKAMAEADSSTGANQYKSPDGISWRYNILIWAARSCSTLIGDFVECGTFRGDMAWMIVRNVEFTSAEKKFYLYDSFSGFDPRYSSQSDFPDSPQLFLRNNEEFSAPDIESSVRQRFRENPHIIITRGIVPDILQEVSPNKVSFLHLDMNSPHAEVAALSFLFDRISLGGIVIFDDYGWQLHRKEKEAADEFAAAYGQIICELPTGQGLMIKR